jgi:hypothetical protein
MREGRRRGRMRVGRRRGSISSLFEKGKKEKSQ